MDRFKEALQDVQERLSVSEEKMKEVTAELQHVKERLSISESRIEDLVEDLRDANAKASKHEKLLQEVDKDFDAMFRKVDMLQGREEPMHGTATSSGTNSREVRKGINKMSKGYFFLG